MARLPSGSSRHRSVTIANDSRHALYPAASTRMPTPLTAACDSQSRAPARERRSTAPRSSSSARPRRRRIPGMRATVRPTAPETLQSKPPGERRPTSARSCPSLAHACASEGVAIRPIRHHEYLIEHARCAAHLRSGERCRSVAVEGAFCAYHHRVAAGVGEDAVRTGRHVLRQAGHLGGPAAGAGPTAPPSRMPAVIALERLRQPRVPPCAPVARQ